MLGEIFNYLGKMLEEDNSSETTSNLWNKKNIRIGHASDRAIFSVQTPVIGNFYVSSYGCPYCGEPLFKTVFPVGREYPIKITEGNRIKMKRVFTCIRCQTFETAAIDLLSDGMVYELKERNTSKYKKLFNEMNNCGTTQGRAD